MKAGNKTWWLTNVVWYDGCDAYVSKFILQADEKGITQESEGLLGHYLNGNGEILKIDRLYPVTLENIIAFKDHENAEESCAYERFKEFYF